MSRRFIVNLLVFVVCLFLAVVSFSSFKQKLPVFAQYPTNPPPPPPGDIAPIGWHESSTGGLTCVVAGWTCDGDKFSQALNVGVYINDGAGYQYVGTTLAGDLRPDVGSSCGGFTNHGFNYTIPATWRDGLLHKYYVKAIGINSSGQPNSNDPWLSGTPKSMTCTVVTPTPSYTPTMTPTPTFYNVYGWVYTEKNNSVIQTEEAAEGLLSGYTVNITGPPNPTTTSQGSQIPGILGNYRFTSLPNGTYNVALPVIPTGSVLYCDSIKCYTNPIVAVPYIGYDFIADFPFVTVTPGGPTATPVFAPSLTPNPTIPPGTPTSQPTPTPIGPTPVVCIPLPTPILNAPAHELCTGSKPNLSAYVSDPNGENVWAVFYSNSYEKFNRMGTSVLPPYPTGTFSQYAPDAYMLNNTGGYWWTAYTQNSAATCTKSADAPAFLLNMDYTAPPAPAAPNCTLQSQDLVSGQCTFSCSWPADPESDGSCGNTSDYHPKFWTSPGTGSWDPGWVGNVLSTNVVTGSDGQLLSAQLEARDSAGNRSTASPIGGPFTCPCLSFSGGSCGIAPPTLTPGGAPTNTPTPTITLTPTITPSPTPGSWVQNVGGDVYFKCTNQPLPTGGNMIISPTGSPNSGGISWTNKSCGTYGFGPTPPWRVSDNLTNTNTFTYYWNSLKSKAPNIDKDVVGDPADINPPDASCTNNIFPYSGRGYYKLSTLFNPTNLKPTTIFLVSGSLEITQDFTVPADKSVVFVVNGNIYVDATVKNIGGLFISSQTFAIAPGSVTTLNIDGMVYASKLDTGTLRSFSIPSYNLTYEPKYTVSLLTCMGRPQVNWQEVKP